MSRQYINIGIAGLSIHDTDQLKHQLYSIFPQHFNIQWKSASDINLDCLFIHERFFDTEGIQRILSRRELPWLKIAKDATNSGQVKNNTLFFPLEDSNALNQWIDINLIQHSEQLSSTEELLQFTNDNNHLHEFDENYFKTLFSEDNHEKLHLFDDQGTLAVIDITHNIAWPNLERLEFKTDLSFKYDFASIIDLTKVSRKHPVILQDWLWNLFWNSPAFASISPVDGHFKIFSWPKPMDNTQRKLIFQMSACFIQGAKMSKISEQYDIPISLLQKFIAANIATQNIKKINLWDKHYSPPPEIIEKTEEQSFVKSFLGKLRRKFGF